MIRAVIVAATIATLVSIWLDQPTHVKPVQVDYCQITVRAAAKDPKGKWRFFWGDTYGPCSHLDRYENA